MLFQLTNYRWVLWWSDLTTTSIATVCGMVKYPHAFKRYTRRVEQSRCRNILNNILGRGGNVKVDVATENPCV